jgi:hypothetical protein
MTLVRVELVERFLLVVLTPATIRGGNTTINTGRVTTNCCKGTTLLEGALTNIHATSITHPVWFTSAVFWAESIFHEFLVGLGSYLSGDTLCVRTMMTVNTWGWPVSICILFIVAITLKSGGVLG